MPPKNLLNPISSHRRETVGFTFGGHPANHYRTSRHDLTSTDEYIDLTASNTQELGSREEKSSTHERETPLTENYQLDTSSGGGGEISENKDTSLNGEESWWEELRRRLDTLSPLITTPENLRPETKEGMMWIAKNLFSHKSVSNLHEPNSEEIEVEILDNFGFTSFMAWYLYGTPNGIEFFFNQPQDPSLKTPELNESSKDLIQILQKCVQNFDNPNLTIEDLFYTDYKETLLSKGFFNQVTVTKTGLTLIRTDTNYAELYPEARHASPIPTDADNLREIHASIPTPGADIQIVDLGTGSGFAEDSYFKCPGLKQVVGVDLAPALEAIDYWPEELNAQDQRWVIIQHIGTGILGLTTPEALSKLAEFVGEKGYLITRGDNQGLEQDIEFLKKFKLVSETKHEFKIWKVIKPGKNIKEIINSEELDQQVEGRESLSLLLTQLKELTEGQPVTGEASSDTKKLIKALRADVRIRLRELGFTPRQIAHTLATKQLPRDEPTDLKELQHLLGINRVAQEKGLTPVQLDFYHAERNFKELKPDSLSPVRRDIARRLLNQAKPNSPIIVHGYPHSGRSTLADQMRQEGENTLLISNLDTRLLNSEEEYHQNFGAEEILAYIYNQEKSLKGEPDAEQIKKRLLKAFQERRTTPINALQDYLTARGLPLPTLIINHAGIHGSNKNQLTQAKYQYLNILATRFPTILVLNTALLNRSKLPEWITTANSHFIEPFSLEETAQLIKYGLQGTHLQIEPAAIEYIHHYLSGEPVVIRNLLAHFCNEKAITPKNSTAFISLEDIQYFLPTKSNSYENYLLWYEKLPAAIFEDFRYRFKDLPLESQLDMEKHILSNEQHQLTNDMWKGPHQSLRDSYLFKLWCHEYFGREDKKDKQKQGKTYAQLDIREQLSSTRLPLSLQEAQIRRQEGNTDPIYAVQIKINYFSLETLKKTLKEFPELQCIVLPFSQKYFAHIIADYLRKLQKEERRQVTIFILRKSKSEQSFLPKSTSNTLKRRFPQPRREKTSVVQITPDPIQDRPYVTTETKRELLNNLTPEQAKILEDLTTYNKKAKEAGRNELCPYGLEVINRLRKNQKDSEKNIQELLSKELSTSEREVPFSTISFQTKALWVLLGVTTTSKQHQRNAASIRNKLYPYEDQHPETWPKGIQPNKSVEKKLEHLENLINKPDTYKLFNELQEFGFLEAGFAVIEKLKAGAPTEAAAIKELASQWHKQGKIKKETSQQFIKEANIIWYLTGYEGEYNYLKKQAKTILTRLENLKALKAQGITLETLRQQYLIPWAPTLVPPKKFLNPNSKYYRFLSGWQVTVGVHSYSKELFENTLQNFKNKHAQKCILRFFGFEDGTYHTISSIAKSLNIPKQSVIHAISQGIKELQPVFQNTMDTFMGGMPRNFFDEDTTPLPTEIKTKLSDLIQTLPIMSDVFQTFTLKNQVPAIEVLIKSGFFPLERHCSEECLVFTDGNYFYNDGNYFYKLYPESNKAYAQRYQNFVKQLIEEGAVKEGQHLAVPYVYEGCLIYKVEEPQDPKELQEIVDYEKYLTIAILNNITPLLSYSLVSVTKNPEGQLHYSDLTDDTDFQLKRSRRGKPFQLSQNPFSKEYIQAAENFIKSDFNPIQIDENNIQNENFLTQLENINHHLKDLHISLKNIDNPYSLASAFHHSIVSILGSKPTHVLNWLTDKETQEKLTFEELELLRTIINKHLGLRQNTYQFLWEEDPELFKQSIVYEESNWFKRRRALQLFTKYLAEKKSGDLHTHTFESSVKFDLENYKPGYIQLAEFLKKLYEHILIDPNQARTHLVGLAPLNQEDTELLFPEENSNIPPSLKQFFDQVINNLKQLHNERLYPAIDRNLQPLLDTTLDGNQSLLYSLTPFSKEDWESLQIPLKELTEEEVSELINKVTTLFSLTIMSAAKGFFRNLPIEASLWTVGALQANYVEEGLKQIPEEWQTIGYNLIGAATVAALTYSYVKYINSILEEAKKHDTPELLEKGSSASYVTTNLFHLTNAFFEDKKHHAELCAQAGNFVHLFLKGQFVYFLAVRSMLVGTEESALSSIQRDGLGEFLYKSYYQQFYKEPEALFAILLSVTVANLVSTRIVNQRDKIDLVWTVVTGKMGKWKETIFSSTKQRDPYLIIEQLHKDILTLAEEVIRQYDHPSQYLALPFSIATPAGTIPNIEEIKEKSFLPDYFKLTEPETIQHELSKIKSYINTIQNYAETNSHPKVDHAREIIHQVLLNHFDWFIENNIIPVLSGSLYTKDPMNLDLDLGFLGRNITAEQKAKIEAIIKELEAVWPYESETVNIYDLGHQERIIQDKKSHTQVSFNKQSENIYLDGYVASQFIATQPVFSEQNEQLSVWGDYIFSLAESSNLLRRRILHNLEQAVATRRERQLGFRQRHQILLTKCAAEEELDQLLIGQYPDLAEKPKELYQNLFNSALDTRYEDHLFVLVYLEDLNKTGIVNEELVKKIFAIARRTRNKIYKIEEHIPFIDIPTPEKSASFGETHINLYRYPNNTEFYYFKSFDSDKHIFTSSPFIQFLVENVIYSKNPNVSIKELTERYKDKGFATEWEDDSSIRKDILSWRERINYLMKLHDISKDEVIKIEETEDDLFLSLGIEFDTRRYQEKITLPTLTQEKELVLQDSIKKRAEYFQLDTNHSEAKLVNEVLNEEKSWSVVSYEPGNHLFAPIIENLEGVLLVVGNNLSLAANGKFEEVHYIDIHRTATLMNHALAEVATRLYEIYGRVPELEEICQVFEPINQNILSQWLGEIGYTNEELKALKQAIGSVTGSITNPITLPDYLRANVSMDINLGNNWDWLADKAKTEKIILLNLSHSLYFITADIAGEFSLSHLAADLKKRNKMITCCHLTHIEIPGVIRKTGDIYKQFCNNMRALPFPANSWILKTTKTANPKYNPDLRKLPKEIQTIIKHIQQDWHYIAESYRHAEKRGFGHYLELAEKLNPKLPLSIITTKTATKFERYAQNARELTAKAIQSLETNHNPWPQTKETSEVFIKAMEGLIAITQTYPSETGIVLHYNNSLSLITINATENKLGIEPRVFIIPMDWVSHPLVKNTGSEEKSLNPSPSAFDTWTKKLYLWHLTYPAPDDSLFKSDLYPVFKSSFVSLFNAAFLTSEACLSHINSLTEKIIKELESPEDRVVVMSTLLLFSEIIAEYLFINGEKSKFNYRLKNMLAHSYWLHFEQFGKQSIMKDQTEGYLLYKLSDEAIEIAKQWNILHKDQHSGNSNQTQYRQYLHIPQPELCQKRYGELHIKTKDVISNQKIKGGTGKDSQKYSPDWYIEYLKGATTWQEVVDNYQQNFADGQNLERLVPYLSAISHLIRDGQGIWNKDNIFVEDLELSYGNWRVTSYSNRQELFRKLQEANKNLRFTFNLNQLFESPSYVYDFAFGFRKYFIEGNDCLIITELENTVLSQEAVDAFNSIHAQTYPAVQEANDSLLLPDQQIVFAIQSPEGAKSKQTGIRREIKPTKGESFLFTQLSQTLTKEQLQPFREYILKNRLQPLSQKLIQLTELSSLHPEVTTWHTSLRHSPLDAIKWYITAEDTLKLIWQTSNFELLVNHAELLLQVALTEKYYRNTDGDLQISELTKKIIKDTAEISTNLIKDHQENYLQSLAHYSYTLVLLAEAHASQGGSNKFSEELYQKAYSAYNRIRQHVKYSSDIDELKLKNWLERIETQSRATKAAGIREVAFQENFFNQKRQVWSQISNAIRYNQLYDGENMAWHQKKQLFKIYFPTSNFEKYEVSVTTPLSTYTLEDYHFHINLACHWINEITDLALQKQDQEAIEAIQTLAIKWIEDSSKPDSFFKPEYVLQATKCLLKLDQLSILMNLVDKNNPQLETYTKTLIAIEIAQHVYFDQKLAEYWLTYAKDLLTPPKGGGKAAMVLAHLTFALPEKEQVAWLDKALLYAQSDQDNLRAPSLLHIARLAIHLGKNEAAYKAIEKIKNPIQQAKAILILHSFTIQNTLEEKPDLNLNSEGNVNDFWYWMHTIYNHKYLNFETKLALLQPAFTEIVEKETSRFAWFLLLLLVSNCKSQKNKEEDPYITRRLYEHFSTVTFPTLENSYNATFLRHIRGPLGHLDKNNEAFKLYTALVTQIALLAQKQEKKWLNQDKASKPQLQNQELEKKVALTIGNHLFNLSQVHNIALSPSYLATIAAVYADYQPNSSEIDSIRKILEDEHTPLAPYPNPTTMALLTISKAQAAQTKEVKEKQFLTNYHTTTPSPKIEEDWLNHKIKEQLSDMTDELNQFRSLIKIYSDKARTPKESHWSQSFILINIARAIYQQQFLSPSVITSFRVLDKPKLNITNEEFAALNEGEFAAVMASRRQQVLELIQPLLEHIYSDITKRLKEPWYEEALNIWIIGNQDISPEKALQISIYNTVLFELASVYIECGLDQEAKEIAEKHFKDNNHYAILLFSKLSKRTIQGGTGDQENHPNSIDYHVANLLSQANWQEVVADYQHAYTDDPSLGSLIQHLAAISSLGREHHWPDIQLEDLELSTENWQVKLTLQGESNYVYLSLNDLFSPIYHDKELTPEELKQKILNLLTDEQSYLVITNVNSAVLSIEAVQLLNDVFEDLLNKQNPLIKPAQKILIVMKEATKNTALEGEVIFPEAELQRPTPPFEEVRQAFAELPLNTLVEWADRHNVTLASHIPSLSYFMTQYGLEIGNAGENFWTRLAQIRPYLHETDYAEYSNMIGDLRKFFGHYLLTPESCQYICHFLATKFTKVSFEKLGLLLDEKTKPARFHNVYESQDPLFILMSKMHEYQSSMRLALGIDSGLRQYSNFGEKHHGNKAVNLRLVFHKLIKNGVITPEILNKQILPLAEMLVGDTYTSSNDNNKGVLSALTTWTNLLNEEIIKKDSPSTIFHLNSPAPLLGRKKPQGEYALPLDKTLAGLANITSLILENAGWKYIRPQLDTYLAILNRTFESTGGGNWQDIDFASRNITATFLNETFPGIAMQWVEKLVLYAYAQKQFYTKANEMSLPTTSSTYTENSVITIEEGYPEHLVWLVMERRLIRNRKILEGLFQVTKSEYQSESHITGLIRRMERKNLSTISQEWLDSFAPETVENLELSTKTSLKELLPSLCTQIPSLLNETPTSSVRAKLQAIAEILDKANYWYREDNLSWGYFGDVLRNMCNLLREQALDEANLRPNSLQHLPGKPIVSLGSNGGGKSTHTAMLSQQLKNAGTTLARTTELPKADIKTILSADQRELQGQERVFQGRSQGQSRFMQDMESISKAFHEILKTQDRQKQLELAEELLVITDEMGRGTDQLNGEALMGTVLYFIAKLGLLGDLNCHYNKIHIRLTPLFKALGLPIPQWSTFENYQIRPLREDEEVKSNALRASQHFIPRKLADIWHQTAGEPIDIELVGKQFEPQGYNHFHQNRLIQLGWVELDYWKKPRIKGIAEDILGLSLYKNDRYKNNIQYSLIEEATQVYIQTLLNPQWEHNHKVSKWIDAIQADHLFFENQTKNYSFKDLLHLYADVKSYLRRSADQRDPQLAKDLLLEITDLKENKLSILLGIKDQYKNILPNFPWGRVEKTLTEISSCGENFSEFVQKTTQSISELIALEGLVALSFNLNKLALAKPQVSDNNTIKINSFRGESLKRLLENPNTLVSNSITLDGTPVLILGPNGSGKTEVLIALSELFFLQRLTNHVPAESAYFPENQQWDVSPIFNIADMLDDKKLKRPLSSQEKEAFVLGMVDEWLNQLDPITRKLVIFDEIGSATNSSEAAYLIRAVIKYLNEKNCQVIIASHVHEAYFDMQQHNEPVQPMTVGLFMNEDKYQLKEGVGESMGLEVARYCGLPLLPDNIANLFRDYNLAIDKYTTPPQEIVEEFKRRFREADPELALLFPEVEGLSTDPIVDLTQLISLLHTHQNNLAIQDPTVEQQQTITNTAQELKKYLTSMNLSLEEIELILITGEIPDSIKESIDPFSNRRGYSPRPVSPEEETYFNQDDWKVVKQFYDQFFPQNNLSQINPKWKQDRTKLKRVIEDILIPFYKNDLTEAHAVRKLIYQLHQEIRKEVLEILKNGQAVDDVIISLEKENPIYIPFIQHALFKEKFGPRFNQLITLLATIAWNQLDENTQKFFVAPMSDVATENKIAQYPVSKTIKDQIAEGNTTNRIIEETIQVDENKIEQYAFSKIINGQIVEINTTNRTICIGGKTVEVDENKKDKSAKYILPWLALHLNNLDTIVLDEEVTRKLELENNNKQSKAIKRAAQQFLNTHFKNYPFSFYTQYTSNAYALLSPEMKVLTSKKVIDLMDTEPVIKLGNLILNLENRMSWNATTLQLNEESVDRISPYEQSLLKILLKQPNTILPEEEIAKEMKQLSYSEKNLRYYLNLLRTKIGYPEADEIIKTTYGLGIEIKLKPKSLPINTILYGKGFSSYYDKAIKPITRATLDTLSEEKKASIILYFNDLFPKKQLNEEEFRIASDVLAYLLFSDRKDGYLEVLTTRYPFLTKPLIQNFTPLDILYTVVIPQIRQEQYAKGGSTEIANQIEGSLHILDELNYLKLIQLLETSKNSELNHLPLFASFQTIKTLWPQITKDQYAAGNLTLTLCSSGGSAHNQYLCLNWSVRNGNTRINLYARPYHPNINLMLSAFPGNFPIIYSEHDLQRIKASQIDEQVIAVKKQHNLFIYDLVPKIKETHPSFLPLEALINWIKRSNEQSKIKIQAQYLPKIETFILTLNGNEKTNPLPGSFLKLMKKKKLSVYSPDLDTTNYRLSFEEILPTNSHQYAQLLDILKKRQIRNFKGEFFSDLDLLQEDVEKIFKEIKVRFFIEFKMDKNGNFNKQSLSLNEVLKGSTGYQVSVFIIDSDIVNSSIRVGLKRYS